ncbi:hypothetical protein BaRGS_00028064, partial [Batillaria attramentaria]
MLPNFHVLYLPHIDNTLGHQLRCDYERARCRGHGMSTIYHSPAFIGAHAYNVSCVGRRPLFRRAPNSEIKMVAVYDRRTRTLWTDHILAKIGRCVACGKIYSSRLDLPKTGRSNKNRPFISRCHIAVPPEVSRGYRKVRGQRSRESRCHAGADNWAHHGRRFTSRHSLQHMTQR